MDMTNILVKDDATAPVETTLVPITDNPNPLWRGIAAGVPFAGQVTLEVNETEQSDGKRKQQALMTIPVMETLGASGTSAGYVAPPKVAYETKVYVTVVSSPRATIADRANALKLAIGAIQGAGAVTATGTLSNTTAGDGWKNSAAQLPQFLINGVRPS